MSVDLSEIIRRVPNHPRPGVLFFDITPVFQEPAALDYCAAMLARQAREREADLILGIEARGLILAGAVAREVGIPLVLARKPGKLPAATIGREYELEYGSDRLEVHAQAIPPGSRVLVHDDLLATGGTALAGSALAEDAGGTVVGAAFIVELDFLPGRAALEAEGHDVTSLVSFASEEME